MCLLTVIDLTKRNSQNQNLGTRFEVFLCFDLISCFVYVIICLLSLVLCFFDVHKHARLLELGFSFMLFFFCFMFLG